MFVDGYEQPNMMKNWNCFLTKIEKLKSFIIKFNKNSAIKAKDYPIDYAVKNEERRPIIVITHNKYIFLAKDKVQKALIWEKVTFL